VKEGSFLSSRAMYCFSQKKEHGYKKLGNDFGCYPLTFQQIVYNWWVLKTTVALLCLVGSQQYPSEISPQNPKYFLLSSKDLQEFLAPMSIELMLEHERFHEQMARWTSNKYIIKCILSLLESM
jgi:hypothetical protein